MPTLADQFSLSQKLADEAQASQLANENMLAKMAAIKAAQVDAETFKRQASQIARDELASQRQPTLASMAAQPPAVGEAAGGLQGLGGTPSVNAKGQTLADIAGGGGEAYGGLDGLGGTPSLNAQGQEAPREPPPAQPKTQFQQYTEQERVIADEADSIAGQVAAMRRKALQYEAGGTSGGLEAAAALRKQALDAEEKLPAARKALAETALMKEQYVSKVLGSVYDEASWNQAIPLIESMRPGFTQNLLKMVPDVRRVDGKFMYGDGSFIQQNIIKPAIERQSTNIEKRKANVDEAELAVKAQTAAQTAVRDANNDFNAKQTQALAREKFTYQQEQEKKMLGSVTPQVAASAAELRKEQITQIKPLDTIQQNIAQGKTYLNTSNTASDRQLNALLTDLDGNVKATNMLFQDNKNFGSLAGKVSGFVSRAFTGRYTEEQRKQIAELFRDIEKTVIQPGRKKIGDYYKEIAKTQGIPEKLVATPDFFGGAVELPTNSASGQITKVISPDEALLQKYLPKAP